MTRHFAHMSPEDEVFLGGLLEKHRARWEQAAEIRPTDQGFAATRNDITGFGKTEKEALKNLSSKELDALLAEVPMKKKPE